MLMRCVDDLIRHVVIGWQVSDIDVKSRGVRRRRRNYFMGGGAHAPRCAAGAPQCALKTLLLRAVITLWGRGAARTRHGVPITSLSYLFDPAAENMEMCGEISFLRCICIYIIIMQYHTNRGCTVVDQVSMLDRHSSGLGFKSRTWLKFD